MHLNTYIYCLNYKIVSPLCQDNAFEFEKKRDEPVRYERELVQQTVKAMKRVEEIKQRRQNQFVKNRYIRTYVCADLHNMCFFHLLIDIRTYVDFQLCMI